MSRYPYLTRQGRWGQRMGDMTLTDGLIEILNDPFNRYHMGVTAENLAERFSLTREEQDEFAVESHRRAVTAIEKGYFTEQIVRSRSRSGARRR